MNRGSDDGELEGLFTLKIPSKTQDIEESTYTVAFEDHVDANNFCYLLESFFEELENFTTDVVPLPTKVRILKFNITISSFSFIIDLCTLYAINVSRKQRLERFKTWLKLL